MKVIRVAIITAAIATAGTAINAQSPMQAPIWTPVLEFRTVAATPDGDRTINGTSLPLALNGQPGTHVITASSNLCVVGGGSQVSAQRAQQADTIWTFSAALEASDSKGFRVRVTSQFDRFAAGAAPAPWTQQLTLREGEEVTIDTIRASSDGPCQVRNLTMRAKVVSRTTDPAAQSARYTADAWLVHTDASGGERRQRVAVTLDDSGPTAFKFDPFAFPLPQLSPLQGDLQAFLSLRGTMRARTRPDGDIDLELDTIRPIGLFHSSVTDHILRGGAQGHKSLTLKDNETIAIDLPAPTSGYAYQTLTPEAKLNVGGGVSITGVNAFSRPAPISTEAVEVKKDVLHLNTVLFFKNHKTQLLIRLHKTREPQ